MCKELIGVGIMAHNEEKVIERCISSLLSQKLREQYRLKIFVVANACTDETESIVVKLCEYTDSLILLKVPEKGKSNAIEMFKKAIINWNKYHLEENEQINKLLFIDADISFVEQNAVYLLAETLAKRPDLSAILPASIPRQPLNVGKRSYLTRLYNAKTALAFAVKGTSFSGQCHMIRNSVAQKIKIPEYIMQEDFYVGEKLKNGYIRDYKIKYYVDVPSSIIVELKRVFRHSLANAQMRSFFHRGLFRNPIVERMAPIETPLYNKRALKKAYRKMPFDYKILLALYYILGRIGDIRAKYILQRYGSKNIKLVLERWKTLR